LSKIRVDISTYVIVLLSFLAGYFEYTFLTIIIIIVHEMGHFLTGYFLKLKVKEISLFMFGGVTIFDEDLNLNIFKELLVVVMGPVVQMLFYMIVYYLYTKGFVSVNTMKKVSTINLILLEFNLLPILPLDGGKILNNILDLILSYDLAHKVSLAVSFLALPLVFLFDNKLIIILVVISLLVRLFEEINWHKFRINKLLLERKLKGIKFKKIREFESLTKVKRNVTYYRFINGIKTYDYQYNFSTK
jgi:stage IV sporulation protein FB